MKPSWLLENGVFDEDLQPMIDEIARQGMTVIAPTPSGVGAITDRFV